MTTRARSIGASDPLGPSLLCRVGPRALALPLGIVLETMRPLPLEPLPGAGRIVLGVSIVRGAPTPVVDLAAVLGVQRAATTRLVTVALGANVAALATTAVVGVRDLGAAPRLALPTLRREGEAGAVAELAALGGEMVVLLDAARVVPDVVWQQIAARMP